MNIFKTLDAVFPTGDNRRSGEVVGISVNVFRDGEWVGTLSMKRKAWYVNASVNAYLMHRHLVRELVNLNVQDLPTRTTRRAKRLVALATLVSYLANRETDEQGYAFNLNLFTSTSGCAGASLWWIAGECDEREVVDCGMTLQTQVDIAVCQLVSRLG